MIPLNEKIWVGVEDKFIFKESKDPTTGERKFIMRGMMMPRGKVSRNGVLYNWESVCRKVEELKGRPLMYNHQLDGRADVPFGHFTNSVIIEDESDVPKGFENVYKGPGWYYEADIDPMEKDIIRKLERGDLRHVSIQLLGESVDEKYNEEFGNYQEATVGDIIEASIVPSPGFLDTTAAVMAEAFGKKEKLYVMTKGDSQITVTDSKVKDWEKKGYTVEYSEDMTTTTAGEAFGKKMKKSNINDWKFTQRGDGGYEQWSKSGIVVSIESYTRNSGDDLWYVGVRGKQGIIHTSKYFTLRQQAIQYAKNYINNLKEDMTTTTAAGAIQPTQDLEKDKKEGKEPGVPDGTGPGKDSEECPFNEDHVEKGIFPMDEFKKGMDEEGKEHPDFDVLQVANIVLDHLMEDEYYYSSKDESFSEGFKVTFGGPDGHQYFQKFNDEKELNKFRKNNPHLMILKKTKERVGADPTQPLMEEEVEEIVESIQNFSKISKEKAEKILEEIFKDLY